MIKSLLVPDHTIEKSKSITNPFLWGIYAVVGISLLFFSMKGIHMGRTLHMRHIFLISLVAGPVVGVLAGFIASYIYYKISDSFFFVPEEVNRQDVFRAMAIVNIPLVLLGIFTLAQYLFYGDIIFNKINPVKFMEDTPSTYYYGMEVLKIGVILWVLVFSLLVLSRLLDIKVMQAFIANAVCALIIYGLGKILLYILVLLL
jgi:hypothetical protein